MRAKLYLDLSGAIEVCDSTGETYELCYINSGTSLDELNTYLTELKEALRLWNEGTLLPSSELGEKFWELFLLKKLDNGDA